MAVLDWPRYTGLLMTLVSRDVVYGDSFEDYEYLMMCAVDLVFGAEWKLSWLIAMDRTASEEM